MSTYAIGDIQGCMEPLQCLLNTINFDAKHDRLWIAGDLINRGPDSLAVMRFLYRIRDSITVVLGNHDLHFIAVALGHRTANKNDTLAELLNDKDLPLWLKWLRQCELLHHDAALEFTMVHAGIPPQWTLAQAQSYSREVEAVLQSAHLGDFLSTMYGNSPDVWQEDLSQQDRYRIITNYFTRMRFCTAQGKLELKTKTDATEAPAGYLPWYEHAERRTKNNNIVFGHWASLEGKTNTPGVYALDTGCVWGGALTAMRLEDKTVFSCKCPSQ